MPADAKGWSLLYVYAVADSPASASRGSAIGLTGKTIAERFRRIGGDRGVHTTFVHAFLLPLPSDSEAARLIQDSALKRVVELGGKRGELAYPRGELLKTGFVGPSHLGVEACRTAYDEAAIEGWLPPLPPEVGASSHDLGLSPSDLAARAGFGAEVEPHDPASLTASLAETDRRYMDAAPVERERIVKWIERGRVGELAKQLCGRVCQICASLGRPAEGFLMRDGRRYVEAHHVEPVSTREAGVLNISNIVVVCANHHRELHYGEVEPSHNEDRFKFHLRDGIATVPRLTTEVVDQGPKPAV